MTLTTLKRLLFFWVTSFTAATLGFYLLWFIMPRHYVFAKWFRMLPYHYQHPVQYILIPCFFYGFIAVLFLNRFYKRKLSGQILTTLLIAALAILVSSPFGGMLWNYHDMQAGYFPTNWVDRMVSNGISEGFSWGWLIIGFSIPFNFLGLVVCFFFTRIGAGLFRAAKG